MEAPKDIHERLHFLIFALGMNPNSFSVAIGVGPPTTDKIIKKKNKPGYDYICKVLVKYPKVNPKWLLLGEGKMWG